MNQSFQQLNDTFNVDCEDIDLNDDLKETEETDIDTNNYKNQKYKLNSHDYLIVELQDQIERIRSAAEDLRQCLKAGAPPRLYEVYSNMEEKISNNLMRIKELEETETDYQVTETKEKIAQKNLEIKQQNTMLRLQKNSGANQQPGQVLINNQTNNYQITSSQLLDEVLAEDEKDDVKSNIITNEKDLPSFNLD